ncbi:hypothetical protein SAMN04244553_0636 [Nocardia amikacinitolerans]|uniref:Uncharacterized protein n=1 Tax=Nocardia amikacinitolerans TaxID=756689 RepID=A0A285KTX4_9NOCA|nr:hypothetical protein [Nocardia amikacinitolerans]MCP2275806.1 hypothetical protein [Nocardia amikacinitolerans]MCP2294078.1 hypothetical protein [Nocardia amikacinitolerans]MCP2315033.1 hypothetical protein [Nocardia amikacinitolerans]SNY76065.1 hypothetical protein SAMN04244553_0636 [Nocardia amikacinitolerans]
MSSTMIKTAAATAMALPLCFLAAPAASANPAPAQPAPVSAAEVTPAGGSVILCFPLGSVVWCI